LSRDLLGGLHLDKLFLGGLSLGLLDGLFRGLLGGLLLDRLCRELFRGLHLLGRFHAAALLGPQRPAHGQRGTDSNDPPVVSAHHQPRSQLQHRIVTPYYTFPYAADTPGVQKFTPPGSPPTHRPSHLPGIDTGPMPHADTPQPSPPTDGSPGPVVILGPTAGGKSDLAVTLAEHLQSEVIGADSMQVYRHLDAGTAKPPAELRGRVPHHCIDIVEPTQRFTVHDWLGYAQAALAQSPNSIVVGGTNLYLKALLEGMFDGPGQDEAYRVSLSGIETPSLHERLQAIDPQTADRVKPADRQRIVRALEVHHLTGKPISELQTQWRDGPPNPPTPNTQSPTPRLIGLRWSPEAINPRINHRVKAMFYPQKVEPEIAAAVCINGESLIDEVKRLRDLGMFASISTDTNPPPLRGLAPDSPQVSQGGRDGSGGAPNQAREALGYKQILCWIEGTDPQIKTTDDAYERTKILTRRFAKQQRTWLKRFAGVHWIECDDADAGRIADEAIKAISK